MHLQDSPLATPFSSPPQPWEKALKQDLDVFVPFTMAPNIGLAAKSSSKDDGYDVDEDPSEVNLWRQSGSLTNIAVESRKNTLGDAVRAMRDHMIRSLNGSTCSTKPSLSRSPSSLFDPDFR